MSLKQTLKYVGKKVVGWGLPIALATSLAVTKPAQAQEFDYYNNSRIEETSQTENNFIYKNGDFSIGLNNILTEGEKPRNVFSSKFGLNDDKTKLYLHVNPTDEGTNLEAKLNQRVGESINFDVGVGNNGLFHTGFQYGFLKPFGFGLSYVRDNENEELRGEIWKYWEDIGLFTGMRKSNDQLLTIISRPSDEDFAVRYANISDFKGDFNFNQLVLGRSRPGYYGLNFGDSWFWLEDSQIIGQDPINIENNPLRYIVPPTAWLVKDFGARLQYIKSGQDHIGEAEVLKYLDDVHWIGADYQTINGDSNSVGLNFGRTSDKLKLIGGVSYDIENQDVSGNIQLRLQF